MPTTDKGNPDSSDLQSYLHGRDREVKSAKSREGLWALLSTMKFAIWILIVLGTMSLIAMFVGEFYQPRLMRPAQGGFDVFVRWLLTVFQMEQAFSSWWYRLLLGILCLSLFACILKRTPLVWRIWTLPPPDVSVIQSSPTAIYKETTLTQNEVKHRLGAVWRFRADTDKVSVAEKGRLGMWGPLLTHIGMLLLGIGALVTSFGNYAFHMGGYAGDMVQLEGMPFTVQIDSFRVTYYPLQPMQWVLVDEAWIGRLVKKDKDDVWEVLRWSRDGEVTEQVEAERIRNRFDNERDRGNIQKFSSFVTIFEDGVPVDRTEIAVNDPLRRAGFRFYQSSYDTDNPQYEADYDSIEIVASDTSAGVRHSFYLSPGEAVQVPDDTLSIRAGRLLPDFKIGQNNFKFSGSDQFINPGLELIFFGPNGFSKSEWVLLNVERGGQPGQYDYALTKLFGERAREEYATIFEIKYTVGTWILWLGFIVATLGLMLSFYLTHKVVYFVWPEGARTSTYVIGTSRRMPLEFEQELGRMLEKAEG
ncbi:cytochrome c biogenesis protein ResB [bacterium]|nr:cytochrome c biogenesis protein ResB [bacterium]